MEILLTVLYFLLLCLALKKLPFFRDVKGLGRDFLLWVFVLKVLAGFVLIGVYTWYYDLAIADFHKYYRDGMVMYEALRENPADYLLMLSGIGAKSEHLSVYYNEMNYWYRAWESPVYNDNRVVIRFNAFAGLFSFGYLGVHNILINFLSLSGLVALYKFLVRYSSTEKLFWLPWGVFLFPSLLFWGSGILKEGLLIWAFGFWVLQADNIIGRKKISVQGVLSFAFFSLMMFLLKPYTLLFWLPCMAAFYLTPKNGWLRIQVAYAGILALLVVLALGLGWLYPQLNIVELIVRKQNDFVNHVMALDAGSIIHSRYIEPGLGNLIVEFLRGLLYAFFRPHPLDASSVFIWIAVFENIIIWAMMVYAIRFFDRKTLLDYPVVWLSIWFAILLMGFVGMITPVFGAIVRYKIPALPFLWVFWVHAVHLPGNQQIKSFTQRKWLARLNLFPL